MKKTGLRVATQKKSFREPFVGCVVVRFNSVDFPIATRCSSNKGFFVLDVYEFHGRYKVSSDGEIFSIARVKIKRLRPYSIRGYLWIELYHPTDKSKRIRKAIHSIVAQAYLGDRPLGFHVNHKDGVKENNSVSNLEYVTPKENIRHAFRLGLNKGCYGICANKETAKNWSVIAVEAKRNKRKFKKPQ